MQGSPQMAPPEAQRDPWAALISSRLLGRRRPPNERLASVQVSTAGVQFKVCVSYVDSIEDSAGDNASTTQ